jgi:hypothetical protein
MTSGYGTPLSELTIEQIEPEPARGSPPVVTKGGRMPTITPISGAPVAPGVTITMQPIDTGGPGIGVTLVKRW